MRCRGIFFAVLEEGDEEVGEVEECMVVEGGIAPGLLELANAGEIQFVRPGEGGGYEVVTQEEAVSLMQSPVQYIQVMEDHPEEQVSRSRCGCDYLRKSRHEFFGLIIGFCDAASRNFDGGGRRRTVGKPEQFFGASASYSVKRVLGT